MRCATAREDLGGEGIERGRWGEKTLIRKEAVYVDFLTAGLIVFSSALYTKSIYLGTTQRLCLPGDGLPESLFPISEATNVSKAGSLFLGGLPRDLGPTDPSVASISALTNIVAPRS